MSVVIRMMRAGAKKRPFYRMVAADSRRQRDGRFLEILGHYDPLADPYELVVNKEKVERWISRGAQPSTQAASLLRTLGIGARVIAAAEAGAAAPEPKAKQAEAKARTRRAPRKLSGRKTKKKAAKRAAKKAAKA
jgi:small subunit ribosomal protein S16